MLLARIVAITVAWLAAAPIPALAQPAPHPTRWYPAPTAEEQQREERLDRRLPEVDFQAAPLQNVVDILRQRSGVPIVVDWDAVGMLEITPQSPVTYRARDIEIRHILAGVCRTLRPGGEIVVGDSPLRITSAELNAHRDDVVRFYPVDDIIDYIAHWYFRRGRFVFIQDEESRRMKPVVATFRDLRRITERSLLTSLVGAVKPDCWEVNGGTSTITLYGPTLIIRSERDVHAEMVDVLWAIREAIAATPLPRAGDAHAKIRSRTEPDAPHVYRRIHTPFYSPRTSETRFKAALLRRMPDAPAGELTFEQAIDRLRTVTGIPIFVDWAEMRDIAIPSDKGIARPAANLTAERYLAAVLQSAGGGVIPLAGAIRPHGLQVTARDSIRSSTRVYTVDDLVVAHAEWLRRHVAGIDASDESPESDELGEEVYFDESAEETIETALTQTVTPDAWEVNGGVGSIAMLGPILVVRQSFESEGDPIQEFLDGLGDSLDLDGAESSAIPVK
ncbi:MAG: hypothetical protein AMXMBFR47_27650 [Planctomycetota bacterium]